MRGLGLWGRTVLSAAMLLVGSVTAQQKGTFTDSRDGQKYKTVKIGTQTWTAENMNVKTGTSWCYDDDESNCKKYGRLYAWQTAVKMVCPSGWRLPSIQEWGNLVKTAGGEKVAGKKLKSKSGWNNNESKNSNGTDVFGFSALPGGLRNDGGDFYGAGNNGNWWTSEEYEGNAYHHVILNDDDGVGLVSCDKSCGFTVRCVADN